MVLNSDGNAEVISAVSLMLKLTPLSGLPHKKWMPFAEHDLIVPF